MITAYQNRKYAEEPEPQVVDLVLSEEDAISLLNRTYVEGSITKDRRTTACQFYMCGPEALAEIGPEDRVRLFDGIEEAIRLSVREALNQSEE